MQYSTTINADAVFGITAARAAYNAALPQTVSSTVEVEVAGEEGEEPTTVTQEVQIPNPALISNDPAYLDFVLTSAIASWCKQYAPVVVPPPVPVEVNGVPQSVTMRQAQLALLSANLLTAVNDAVTSITGDAGVAARITWEKSTTVERNNPLINTLATIMGLTSEQIDNLFKLAITL